MKVNVEYEKLESSAKNLDDIDKQLEECISKLEETKDSIKEDGKTHDDCYSIPVGTLDNIINCYKNHQTALQFIKEQCQAASAAFKSAEGDNIDLAKEDAKKYVLSLWDIIKEPGESKPEIDDLELEEYEDKDLKAAIAEATKATTSETWDGVFNYGDDDGDILTDTGASISKEAKSIIDPDGTENPGEPENPNEPENPKSRWTRR